MSILKRIGYYLVGLTFGTIVVLFIWKGKDVSFDYGMDARTLKSIRTKKIEYSKDAKHVLTKVDTTEIIQVLTTGDVDFSKSKARQKPCAEYYITGNNKQSNIHLYVKRCDSVSIIEKITLDN